jgi:hypothetical protein
MLKFIALSVFALSAAVAQDHPSLAGTWVLDPAHSVVNESKIKSQTLTIDQQAESVKLSETTTESGAKPNQSEISCNTAGQSCKIKDHGAAEVSFWYNGPMLVMSEMRHGNDWVVKRRLKPSPDGHTLTIEVIHLVPVQTTETLTFTKQ